MSTSATLQSSLRRACRQDVAQEALSRRFTTSTSCYSRRPPRRAALRTTPTYGLDEFAPRQKERWSDGDASNLGGKDHGVRRIPAKDLEPHRTQRIPFEKTPIRPSIAPPNINHTDAPGAKAKFPTQQLSYHWDTVAPTNDQLAHAAGFFQRQPATFLWSSEKFKDMDFSDSDSPEVCFLGRSNVGKSSLLNAILLKKLAHTSAKPGRTRLMNAFAVGNLQDNKNRLVILDMPGYGKGGRAEWGKEIMKYLAQRRSLKRVFLLVNANHGLKATDVQILESLKQLKVPFQIVLSKADDILFDGKKLSAADSPIMKNKLSELRTLMESIKEAVQVDTEDDGPAVGEVIACSSTRWIDGHRMGINELRFAMLRAAGMEHRPAPKPKKAVELVSHEELIGRIPHFP